MIYIVVISTLVVFLLYLNSPEKIEVSAQSPQDTAKVSERSLLPNDVVLANGQAISLRRKIIATVRGDSAKHLKIHDGTKLIADRLSSATRCDLKTNDMVIINSPTKNGNNPFRLRQIKHVTDGTVSFRVPPNSKYGQLRDRSVNAVYARVSHVQEAA